MGDGYLINSLWGVGRPSSAEVGLNGHPGRVSAGLNRLEFQDGKAGTIYLTPPTCGLRSTTARKIMELPNPWDKGGGSPGPFPQKKAKNSGKCP